MKTKLFILLLGIVILNPTLVLAQNTNANTASQASAQLPQYNRGVDTSIKDFLCAPSEVPDGQDLARCINRVYKFGVAFGAFALVFFIVWAGYMYMVGGEAAKGKAKGMIMNSLAGMGLLLGSYVLLSFINPNLVAYRPIAPPTFQANWPDCEDVGFEEDCLIVAPDGTTTAVPGGGSGGSKVECPGGKIVSAKGLGLPTKQADEQICEAFGKLIVQAKPKLSGLDWRITDTIGSGHLSSCHKSGNAYSGTCADIGLNVKTTANWNQVCRAMKEVGLSPVNEADGNASDCPKYGTYSTTTGAHIHVNWRR